jgi:xylulokinase
MYLLGIDIGTSSIKASVLDGETGNCLATAYYPETESPIISVKAGWAEQEPEMWWDNLKAALKKLNSKLRSNSSNLKSKIVNLKSIGAIGISYQMHGLVIIDKERKPLRPSIIWCDSRAVETGGRAFKEIGKQKCLENLLNSPGNFTASKLKWVKEYEPDIYKRIYKMMLPGDYIAMKLSGEINTTITGLSEGILWNFKENKTANMLLDYYGIDSNLIPDIIPVFSNEVKINSAVAEELGLKPGIKISYRAGDQPNNALSLNVLNPGEIAATAGTSGVVYGVTDKIKYDPESRVNTFAHVNHNIEVRNQKSEVRPQTSDLRPQKIHNTRLGVLLCINGTGILYSWLKKNFFTNEPMTNEPMNYNLMNELASKVSIGSEGLVILPFGNGAERILRNKIVGSYFADINFNLHSKAHIFRAAQEGIAFSFKYGIDILNSLEIGDEKFKTQNSEPGTQTNHQFTKSQNHQIIRAGKANLFLSPVFCEALSCISNSTIELYETDGALGAARGAGVGAGFYKDFNEAFSTLKKLKIIEPDNSKTEQYNGAYKKWLDVLNKTLIK